MGNCLSSCAKSSSEVLPNNDEKREQLVPEKTNTIIISQPATCSPIKIFASNANDNDIRVLVQKELAALQAQIKHSQAVLESLGTASQGNGRKRVAAFVHRTTQTLGQETQPRSLESIPTKDKKADKDWKSNELASSCPAIVTNVSIAVQTDHNRQVGLTLVEVQVDSELGQDQDCFLPPISPFDSVNSHQSRTLHKVSSGSTVEPRSLDLDLDIYRSCRKLSVLPEEEVCEAPPSPHLLLLSGTQQAHSFESYLHPNSSGNTTGPVRQLSDPTPANSSSPPPRVSTRRPLQIQTPQTHYFRFPETSSFETDSGLESKPTRSGSRSSPTYDIDERITSPTYGILQDTVSQLVTFSPLLSVQSLEVPPLAFINSPETSPYKTPPEGFSNVQTPDYCSTPHSEISYDARKKSIESVSESLSFQTLSDCSPGNVNNPNASPAGSPFPIKRASLIEDSTTLVTDLNNPSQLVVKPLHSMLSILMDPKPKAKPEAESLTRASSRRRLTRSLMRVSSQTPLELVSVREPLPVQPDSTSSSVETVIRVSDLHEKPVQYKEPGNRVDSLENSASFENMQNEGGTENNDSAHLKRSLSGTSGTSSNFTSQSFPSLSDNVLRQLGLWLEEKQSALCDTEPQSEKEIENKFTSLLLAFQTDKLTLSSRLELQNRLRDQAEHNLNVEIQQLQVAVTHLVSNRSTELTDLQNQINTLSKAAMRVSSAAEMYGAVQQESRLSRAVDIILSHVDNLKQAYNKEKTEHVETKKVLSENKSVVNLPVQKARCRRRATIAVGVAQLGTNVSSHDNNSVINSASLDARAGSFILRSRFQRHPQLSRERSNSIDNFQVFDKQISVSTEEDSEQSSLLQRRNSNEKKLSTPCSHKECNCDLHSESELEEDESETSDQEELISNTSMVESYQSKFFDHWSNILSSTDELVLHARYGIAGILIVAAIAIFCSMLYL